MSWPNITRRVTIGPGDFEPPDEPRCFPPQPETVYRFAGCAIVDGVLCIVETPVKVDPETREVLRYGARKRRTPVPPGMAWRVREYAAKHPRKGPKLLAALAAMEATR